jgi:hypothetical protein
MKVRGVRVRAVERTHLAHRQACLNDAEVIEKPGQCVSRPSVAGQQSSAKARTMASEDRPLASEMGAGSSRHMSAASRSNAAFAYEGTMSRAPVPGGRYVDVNGTSIPHPRRHDSPEGQ